MNSNTTNIMKQIANDNLESVCVRMSKKQRKKITRIAKENNRTVSGQLREMIDRA